MLSKIYLTIRPIAFLAFAVGVVMSNALLPQAVAQLPTNFTDAAKNAKAQNILLVHGAWGDGSSFSKVIPLLQE